MKRYIKLKSGFTFIEVMIAVVVIGSLLTTLMQTQAGLILITGNSESRASRVVDMWNAFVYAQRQSWYQKGAEQQDINLDGELQYQYEQHTISEQSSLAPYAQVGVVEHVIARDEEGDESRLVLYRYQPPRQEEEST